MRGSLSGLRFAGLIFRKVENCELSMDLYSGYVISNGGSLFCFESPKAESFSIDLNNRLPFFVVFNYALESARIITESFSVLAVLLLSALPKILSTIIERIPVFMVTIRTKNNLVHCYIARAIMSTGIKTLVGFRPMSKPVPLRKPFEISSINYRVLISRQWEKAIRFVTWLRHFVSGNTSLIHKFSMKELVLRSHSIAQDYNA